MLPPTLVDRFRDMVGVFCSPLTSVLANDDLRNTRPTGNPSHSERLIRRACRPRVLLHCTTLLSFGSEFVSPTVSEKQNPHGPEIADR